MKKSTIIIRKNVTKSGFEVYDQSIKVDDVLYSIKTLSRPYRTLVDLMTLRNFKNVAFDCEVVKYRSRESRNEKYALLYTYQDKKYFTYAPQNIMEELIKLIEVDLDNIQTINDDVEQLINLEQGT